MASIQPADLVQARLGPTPVSIIVPVYGAAQHLDRCLVSVLRHSGLPPAELLVLVDGPQDREVEAVLTNHLGTGDTPGTRLIRNEVRRGFVASVNRGMRESNRDVVLLNSDTEVTAGWLEKLRAAADSAPDIATVTPLSNAATICSLPELLEDNLLPEGTTTDELGEIVGASLAPRLPAPANRRRRLPLHPQGRHRRGGAVRRVPVRSRLRRGE